MYGYTFRGSNSVIYIFASLLDRGQLLKETICSYKSKLFPLRVDLLLKVSSREANRSHESSSPLQKWQKNIEVYLKVHGTPPCFCVAFCLMTCERKLFIKSSALKRKLLAEF